MDLELTRKYSYAIVFSTQHAILGRKDWATKTEAREAGERHLEEVLRDRPDARLVGITSVSPADEPLGIQEQEDDRNFAARQAEVMQEIEEFLFEEDRKEAEYDNR